jgi:hypothetical protein
MRQAAYMGRINTQDISSIIQSNLNAIVRENTANDTPTEEPEAPSPSTSESSQNSGHSGTSASQTSSELPHIVQGLAVDPHQKAPRASRKIHSESRAARNEHGEIMRSPGGGIVRAAAGAPRNFTWLPSETPITQARTGAASTANTAGATRPPVNMDRMANLFQTLNGQRVQTDWERTNTELLRRMVELLEDISRRQDLIVRALNGGQNDSAVEE